MHKRPHYVQLAMASYRNISNKKLQNFNFHLCTMFLAWQYCRADSSWWYIFLALHSYTGPNLFRKVKRSPPLA